MKHFIALFLIVLVLGCTQTATNGDINKSIQEMKDSMQKNPGDVPTEPVYTDADFSPNKTIKTGQFQNLNYMSSGTASVVEKDGKLFVVLGADFSTPNGPDLVLYLTKNSAATTRNDIAQGIELQKLKSIKGMQVYELPAGIDIDLYNSVTIHCRAFNVPWSYASLQ